jgi:hypothetical protein
LRRCGYQALGQVCCEFHEETGLLRLHGSVPSYYLKQVALGLVLDLEDVREIDNQIIVAGPFPRGTAPRRERDEQADASSGTRSA